MSAPESTVIQSNFKIGQGLHNIYATNGAEYKELIELFEGELIGLIADVEKKIATANSLGVGSATPAPAVAGTQRVTPPAATPPAAEGEAPLCEHGVPAKLVPAGISKASGKPYRAFYACAQPRATQCAFKASV